MSEVIAPQSELESVAAQMRDEHFERLARMELARRDRLARKQERSRAEDARAAKREKRLARMQRKDTAWSKVGLTWKRTFFGRKIEIRRTGGIFPARIDGQELGNEVGSTYTFALQSAQNHAETIARRRALGLADDGKSLSKGAKR